MENAWVLIPIAAIIGSMFLRFRKQELEMREEGHQNEKEIEDLRKFVDKLKARIENLEAIAAGAPDEFKTGAGRGSKEIEIDEFNNREENQKETSKLANDLRE